MERTPWPAVLAVSAVLVSAGCAPNTATPEGRAPSAAPPPPVAGKTPSRSAAAPKSADIVRAFRDAGLGVTKSFPLSRSRPGLAPPVSSDMTRFLIPSLGEDAGGRAFVCEDKKGAASLVDYYRALSDSGAEFTSHVFTKDRLVVQINGDLPDAEAARYKAVLDKL